VGWGARRCAHVQRGRSPLGRLAPAAARRPGPAAAVCDRGRVGPGSGGSSGRTRDDGMLFEVAPSLVSSHSTAYVALPRVTLLDISVAGDHAEKCRSRARRLPGARRPDWAVSDVVGGFS
jgi:hypothetical protein